MDEAERAFTDAFRRAAGDAPPMTPPDPDELARRARRSSGGLTWLAVAAVVVLVAGIGLGVFLLRGGPVLAVPAGGVSGSEAFVGVTWYPVEALGEQIPQLDAMEPPWLVFGEDGRVSGHDGCTAIDRGYRSDGTTLTFDAATSHAVCDFPFRWDFPDNLFEVFERTRSVEATGTRLVLLDGSGEHLAEFTSESAGVTAIAWGGPSTNPTATPTTPTGPVTPTAPIRPPDETSPPPASTEPTVSVSAPPEAVFDEARALPDAPDQVRDGAGRTSCGEFVLGQGERVPTHALTCLERYLGTDDVELAFTTPTTEGDPIVVFVIGTAGSTKLDVWQTSHWDAFGQDGWDHRGCTSVPEGLGAVLAC